MICRPQQKIFQMIRSRKRRAEHVVRMEKKGGCTHVFGGGNLKERDHLLDLDVDVRTVLERIFKKWN